MATKGLLVEVSGQPACGQLIQIADQQDAGLNVFSGLSDLQCGRRVSHLLGASLQSQQQVPSKCRQERSAEERTETYPSFTIRLNGSIRFSQKHQLHLKRGQGKLF
jgi:hypothetical protein